MMLASDSVGGAEESRNGFSNRSPVNVTDKSAAMDPRFGMKGGLSHGPIIGGYETPRLLAPLRQPGSRRRLPGVPLLPESVLDRGARNHDGSGPGAERGSRGDVTRGARPCRV